MQKRKITLGKIWLIGLAVLLLAAGGLALFVKAQKEKLASLKEAVVQLKEEQIPLRFQVVRRTENGLETKIKLYDLNGREIAAESITLKGESLFWDFVSVPVDGKYLAFPKSVFTEAIPAEKGRALFSTYDQDGFPGVFADKDMKEGTKNDLKALFAALKQGKRPGGAFGNAVHDIKELKTFETGIVYKVVTRLKGGIEIMEDEQ